MATVLPRLQVTITEEQRALLQELGELQGRSAASYLREMLDASTPMLKGLVDVFRKAAEAEAKQPEVLQQAIRTALEGIDAQRDQLSLLEHLAAVEPSLANDQGGAGATPSGAREDAGTAPRRRRKRA